MVHGATTVVPHLVAGILEAPAEVDFLHVRKKGGLQAAQSLPGRAAHQQAGPAGPGHRARVVVLALVAFEGVEEATTAEGVGQAVEVAAAGPRVFEVSGVGVGQDFGLHGGNARAGFQQGAQRAQPAERDFHVGIQQDKKVAINLLQRLVVAFAEAEIALQQQKLHGGKVAGQQLHRVVGRSIVGHDNAGSIGVGNNAGQEAAQKIRSVPVQDNQRYIGAGFEQSVRKEQSRVVFIQPFPFRYLRRQ